MRNNWTPSMCKDKATAGVTELGSGALNALEASWGPLEVGKRLQVPHLCTPRPPDSVGEPCAWPAHPAHRPASSRGAHLPPPPYLPALNPD